MSADKDLISVQQARDLVEGAYKAQAEIVKFDQGMISERKTVLLQKMFGTTSAVCAQSASFQSQKML